MPTINSWASQNPAEVAKGGTGLNNAGTAYGVLAAGTTGTSAFQNIGVGSAGQVLTSNGAGVLPSFQGGAKPEFYATASADVLNATGNGVSVNPVVFGTVVFDTNSNFSGNVFTAPTTGKYFLSATVRLSNVQSNHTVIDFGIETTNRIYVCQSGNPATTRDANTNVSYTVNTLSNMNAGDTAKVFVGVYNGSQVITISGQLVGFLDYTYFSGFQVS